MFWEIVLAPPIILRSDGAYRPHPVGPKNPRRLGLLCDQYLVFASDGPQCDFLQAALYNRSLDGSPAGRVEREKARKAEWNPAMTSERKWNNS
jgi:hypothetical protein